MSTDEQQFVSILGDKIDELEKRLGTSTNSTERDQLRFRKRQLREITKYVSDKGHSAEDRMAFLLSKFSSMMQELLKFEKQQGETQSQLDAAQRDRDKAQDALRRSSLLQVKLEELCRQLQKENKEIREQEDAARKAQAERFQAAIQNVTTTLDAQAAERANQIAEHSALRERLEEQNKAVMKQVQAMQELLQHKDKEVSSQAALLENLQQRNELLEKVNANLMEAFEAARKELETLAETRQTNSALQAANADLKEQLETYYTKFSEFQQTVEKSNKMFDSLRKELDNGSKLRASLTKERDELRRRCGASDANLAQALSDKQTLQQQVSKLTALASAVQGVDAEEVKRLKSQKDALEGLCRTLTAQLKAAKADTSAAGTPPSSVGSTSQAEALANLDMGSTGSELEVSSSNKCLVPAMQLPAGMQSVGQLPRSPRYQGHGKSGPQASATKEVEVDKGFEALQADGSATVSSLAAAASNELPSNKGAKLVAYGGVLLPATLDSCSSAESGAVLPEH